MESQSHSRISSKSSNDRRINPERRRRERRNSIRYPAGALIVLDGVTWLNDEGEDRRRLVRRRQDRERLAARILELAE